MCLSIKYYDWKGPSNDEARGTVLKCPLCCLRDLTFKHIDSLLMLAFLERQQPNTNTFHMHFGEMMITLHDVQLILGISARGLAVKYGLSNNYLANLIIQQVGSDRDSKEKCVKKCGIGARALQMQQIQLSCLILKRDVTLYIYMVAHYSLIDLEFESRLTSVRAQRMSLNLIGLGGGQLPWPICRDSQA